MFAQMTALILAYKYWAIVPFALFEAPLMSIVIGFLAATDPQAPRRARRSLEGKVES